MYRLSAALCFLSSNANFYLFIVFAALEGICTSLKEYTKCCKVICVGKEWRDGVQSKVGDMMDWPARAPFGLLSVRKDIERQHNLQFHEDLKIPSSSGHVFEPDSVPSITVSCVKCTG